MTPPIPRRMLPSTAEVRVPDASPGLGGRYLDPVTLRHVRLDREDGASHDGYRLSAGALGTLYVDAVSTEGAFAIPRGSLVSVDGGEPAAATSCEELRDGMGRVHHWEVALG